MVPQARHLLIDAADTGEIRCPDLRKASLSS
jgi:hypothetical protein